MNDEKQIWDQQECEPNLWYQRFSAFRLLGPSRSYRAAWQNEKVSKGHERSHKSITNSWRKAIERWNWKPRAEAWDKYNTAQAESKWQSKIMSEPEILARLSDIARGDIADMMDIESMSFDVSLQKAQEAEKTHLIKKVKQISKMIQGKNGDDTETHIQEIELYPADDALVNLGKIHGLFKDKELELPDDTDIDKANSILLGRYLDAIADSFDGVSRDIRRKRHTEYLFYGGRGSTKSSFVSLTTIYLLIINPELHALACRQVGNTLRDSVYSQLQWAIGELGLSDKFKCTTSPLGIEYLPTKQQIYFRGADDPLKIKSIKPPFGYIGILWFEELDSFHGPEQIRSIEQSAIRGGDEAYIFKNFNPPRTANNWANKYTQIPKDTQFQHRSDYTTVPIEWLGKTFLEEAEHLKTVNPKAYEHEYLGIVNGTGGQVFENVKIRKITDEEIAQFDRILEGMDFGWYPDPLAWGKSHFDAARRVLYIFDEYKANKKANKAVYTDLVKVKGYTSDQLIIADSASPKDIADFRDYGASMRGAEKGPESVNYSIKWLQSLTEIVIDPERCPEHMQEFLNYELEQDKDGDFITAYPDRDNHFIDEVRYATNLIWRRRGQ